MTARKEVTGTLSLLVLTAVLFGSLSVIHTELLHAAPKREAASQEEAKVVNVNKASLEELQTIRGIGPALAERIVKYRDEHGPFKKVEDLVAVQGIGEAKLEKMKSQVAI